MDAFSLDRISVDDGIELRRFVSNDAKIVFETVSENREHLAVFMHWMTPDYSITSAKEFITRSAEAAEKKESLGFGIFLEDKLIGSIGFVNFDWKARKTEVGYWISKDQQGKGIVSRCCHALLSFAFEDLDINRVEIRCSAKNIRSAAIPERFGFTLEGRLREAELRGGELHDFLLYGLLRSEWKQ